MNFNWGNNNNNNNNSGSSHSSNQTSFILKNENSNKMVDEGDDEEEEEGEDDNKPTNFKFMNNNRFFGGGSIGTFSDMMSIGTGTSNIGFNTGTTSLSDNLFQPFKTSKVSNSGNIESKVIGKTIFEAKKKFPKFDFVKYNYSNFKEGYKSTRVNVYVNKSNGKITQIQSFG